MPSLSLIKTAYKARSYHYSYFQRWDGWTHRANKERNRFHCEQQKYALT